MLPIHSFAGILEAREYVCAAFSAENKLLITQGGPPDWTLILWSWDKAPRKGSGWLGGASGQDLEKLQDGCPSRLRFGVWTWFLEFGIGHLYAFLTVMFMFNSGVSVNRSLEPEHPPGEGPWGREGLQPDGQHDP